MVKRVLVVIQDAEYADLVRQKGSKTWLELIRAGLGIGGLDNQALKHELEAYIDEVLETKLVKLKRGY